MAEVSNDKLDGLYDYLVGSGYEYNLKYSNLTNDGALDIALTVLHKVKSDLDDDRSAYSDSLPDDVMGDETETKYWSVINLLERVSEKVSLIAEARK